MTSKNLFYLWQILDALVHLYDDAFCHLTPFDLFHHVFSPPLSMLANNYWWQFINGQCLTMQLILAKAGARTEPGLQLFCLWICVQLTNWLQRGWTTLSKLTDMHLSGLNYRH